MAVEPKEPDDYRAFLFRATGTNTNIAELSPMEAVDNLLAEMSRLAGVADLLGQARMEIAPKLLRGISEVIGDSVERSRAILRLLAGQDKEEEDEA